MHPSLSVDEIIRLIANEIVASESKSTAVALACCCKSFEEPVLDALWDTQDRLTPLLKCFPQHIWEGAGGYFVSPLTVFVPLCLTVQYQRISIGSQRKQNALISENMLEECGSS